MDDPTLSFWADLRHLFTEDLNPLNRKTGKVMGRSLVEIDYMGAMGKGEAARFAVQKLTLW